ncbi:hypothetical protein R50073_42170 [Maricurvus nonylphenolicus]
MPLVQVAHGGHKTNTFTGHAFFFQGVAEGGNVVENLHIFLSLDMGSDPQGQTPVMF